jgi:effector-binding domain-containing protein
VSSGTGSIINWNGENNLGSAQTQYTRGNDSIVQKMELNESSSTVFWTFKDTIGGTKVTLKSNGKMNFMMKVNAFFTGGYKSSLAKDYEQSLTNLDKSLDIEIKTYKVKIIGIVNKLETYYLKQSFTSKIADIERNADVVFPKIEKFCTQNNISLNGRPFIIYHTYDTIKKLTKVSFCIPIKEEIFTSQGSEILSGKLLAFNALKSSLTGNYSYKDKAYKESIAHASKNSILIHSDFDHLEIFTRNKKQTKNPSKWLTELYFPLKPKLAPRTYKPVVRDSLATTPKPVVNKVEESEF